MRLGLSSNGLQADPNTSIDPTSDFRYLNGLFLKLGPLLVIDYITAHNIYRYQTGTLILGNTHITNTDTRHTNAKNIMPINRSPMRTKLSCSRTGYLEDHGDLVRRLIMGITSVIIWLMTVS